MKRISAELLARWSPSNEELQRARPAKTPVDRTRVQAAFVEPECSRTGETVDVAALFLTGGECPWRCVMCDPPGSIPLQIQTALATLPPARQIKLYNSSNFFDSRAVPIADRPAIARAVQGFETVVVENHPKLCGDDCREFAAMLSGRLEAAIGLETVHPQILPWLNKGITPDDFARATARLRGWDIDVRAFVLLKPPFLEEREAIDWALRTAEFAYDCGAECCSIIPVRDGNGIMERLGEAGLFSPPSLAAMEELHRRTLELRRGRAFIDLWNAARFADEPRAAERIARLHRQNLTQRVEV
jgi:uncharacterized Fe-S cluster-containing MiaB family protein